ncbi:branched-subunit amino acid transport protein [Rivibacter subsaxonicus]|uniref:Branched-subunit amino acid transport protein n=2 Tax=Rivibacter subsaxonicus TaxID=457575 RepID=A0A4Q7VVH3_9BURK|nr:branched-subunit amino acid transport protein [Rivibacter subsaxonicus]
MIAAMSTTEVLLAVVGLTVITVFTRCFFFISEREIAMPGWLKRGLRYAPLAALAAVVVPEIVMVQGELITAPWRDARVYSAVVATLYFFCWRRDILGTIVTGMLVLLPLRIGLGW